LSKSHVELGSDLALRLLDELDATTAWVGELERMIEEATANDENDRRRTAMMKAISLPARAMTLKTIAQALGALNEADGPKGKKEIQHLEAHTAHAGSDWERLLG
jgi:hypothetical protein